jgi:carotenoid cleavage dioxygenase
MQTDGVANTNIVRHANRLLALEEGHAPIEMDSASLATIGTWTYNNQLPRNMTAHPKIDPRTGELLFFANVPNGRLTGELDYYLANAAGDLIRSQRFQGPFPALVHDFAVTPDFVVFGICPVTLSLSRARAGGPLIAWEPDRGTHVGIIPRRGGASDFQWFAGPSCMVWHFMNAFNEGNRIVVDGCQQKSAMFPAADGSPPDSDRASQYLTRWEFDWTKPGNFRIDRLSEVRCEYPRIDERRTGLSYRHGYVAFIGGPGSADLFHRGLGHFDHANQTMQIYDAGPRCAVAEPVFVPRASGSPEGEGYLLTNVFDEDRNASHLAIFDAEQVESGPIARAHLGHRVPVGFHANWSPR